MRRWAFQGESAVAVGERVGDALLKDLACWDVLDGIAEDGRLDDLKQSLIDAVWKALNPQEMQR